MKKLVLQLLVALWMASGLYAFGVGDPARITRVWSTGSPSWETLSTTATSTVKNHTGPKLQVEVTVPPQPLYTQNVSVNTTTSYGGVLSLVKTRVDRVTPQGNWIIYTFETNSFNQYSTLTVTTWDNTSRTSGRFTKMNIR